ncbi:hypothetical protein DCC62_24930 [candidate division KSB1 bacterium]|nr:MAG: hypothetical protein DCC62_24930 [candidate division KSB1 bacterium]
MECAPPRDRSALPQLPARLQKRASDARAGRAGGRLSSLRRSSCSTRSSAKSPESQRHRDWHSLSAALAFAARLSASRPETRQFSGERGSGGKGVEFADVCRDDECHGGACGKQLAISRELNVAKPRVLIISEFYPHAAETYAGIFVREQISHFKSCEVAAVIAPAVQYPPLPRYRRLRAVQPAAGAYQEAGYPVIRVPVHYLPVLAESFACREFYRRTATAIAQHRLEFDLIHAHWAYRSGFVASKLAQKFAKPFVLTAQGSDIHTWMFERRKRAKILAALQAADAIIALNESLRNTILAEGVAEDKLHVIPQGVDCEAFQPAHLTDRNLHAAVNESSFVFLCVANHHHVKGVDILLRALALADDETALTLVGAGPGTPALKSLAQSLGLGSRVTFAGAQSPESIPDWINAADAIVIPSRNEGGPAVLLQAMACGKPVVATAVGMVPAVITDERLGLIVPVEDTQALAAALERVRTLSWDASHIRDQVLSFSWPNISARIEDVYSVVLEQRKNETSGNESRTF